MQIVQPQVRTSAKTHKYKIRQHMPHAHMPSVVHQPAQIHPSIHIPLDFNNFVTCMALRIPFAMLYYAFRIFLTVLDSFCDWRSFRASEWF